MLQELRLRGDEIILNLGCGSGAFASRLASLVPRGRVIALDASEKMIRIARTYARSNLDFIRQQPQTIACNAEFDLVISHDSMHLVKDHQDLLTRIHRALRPGGIVRFSFAAAGNAEEEAQSLRLAMEQVDFADALKNFSWPWFTPSKSQYERIVACSPFHDSFKAWEDAKDIYFSSLTPLIAWLDQHTLPPFLAALPDEDTRDLFRAYVITRLISATRRPDNHYRLHFVRLNFAAQRR